MWLFAAGHNTKGQKCPYLPYSFSFSLFSLLCWQPHPRMVSGAPSCWCRRLPTRTNHSTPANSTEALSPVQIWSCRQGTISIDYFPLSLLFASRIAATPFLSWIWREGDSFCFPLCSARGWPSRRVPSSTADDSNHLYDNDRLHLTKLLPPLTPPSYLGWRPSSAWHLALVPSSVRIARSLHLHQAHYEASSVVGCK